MFGFWLLNFTFAFTFIMELTRFVLWNKPSFEYGFVLFLAKSHYWVVLPGLFLTGAVIGEINPTKLVVGWLNNWLNTC